MRSPSSAKVYWTSHTIAGRRWVLTLNAFTVETIVALPGVCLLAVILVLGAGLSLGIRHLNRRGFRPPLLG